LDAARSETVWNKAKSELAKQGLALSLKLLKVALVTAAKGMIDKH